MEGNAPVAQLSLPNFILDFVPGFGGTNDDVVRSRQRSTLILIAAFWVFTFTVMSVRASVLETLPFDVLGPRRLLTSAFGTLLCLIMVRLLGHLRTSSFPRWIAWGMIGAFAMAVSLTAFRMTMNRILMPLPGTSSHVLPEFVQWALIYFGYCLAWTGTHLALTYHWQVEDERQRAAALIELAQEAQIAALVRTLQTEPTVLLLDEPTAALDPASARAIEALLQHWFAQAPERHAWVWITHDPAQAARIGQQHWRVEAGHLQTEPSR